ncbi:MAG: glutaminyl-peptide cyclotransferase, partial [bacterium]|nr:glutaminyl-peptide cyclotransferase [bacterium]
MTRRFDPRRAGGAGYIVAALALVFLSGCAGISPPEPPVTAEPEQGRADSEPTSVASTSTTGPPETGPVSVPEAEPEADSKRVTPSTSAATTAVAPDASTIPTTTEAAAPPEPGDHPATAEPSGTREVLVLDALPHDPAAFTQGLVLHGGVFYESTGRYGASSVRIVDRETGEVLSSVILDDGFFGEGLEVVDGRVVQLTWKEQTAFIWDAATLEPLGTYTYSGEGWGLCAMEDRFEMSDGSSTLTFRDLDSFQV